MRATRGMSGTLEGPALGVRLLQQSGGATGQSCCFSRYCSWTSPVSTSLLHACSVLSRVWLFCDHRPSASTVHGFSQAGLSGGLPFHTSELSQQRSSPRLPALDMDSSPLSHLFLATHLPTKISQRKPVLTTAVDIQISWACWTI